MAPTILLSLRSSNWEGLLSLHRVAGRGGGEEPLKLHIYNCI